MAKPEAPEAAEAAAPKKKSPLMLIVAALVVVLAGGGGAGWFFFVHKAGAKTKPAEEHVEEAKPPAHVLKAGTVVVNIAGTEGKRYLRTTVEVGAAAKDAKHLEEMKAPIMDAALAVLGQQELETLLEPGDRHELRETLLKRFNAALGHPMVTHVYLTEFIVQ